MSSVGTAQPEGPHIPAFWPLVVASLVFVGASLAAAVRWHLSTEQLSFLGIAFTALLVAWLVGRYGIIGFSERSESGGVTETSVTRAPLPRRVLVPALLLGAVCFALAATPTPAGRALFAPAHGTVELYHLGKNVFSLFVCLGLIGAFLFCLVGGLVKHNSDWLAVALALGILISIVSGVSYGMYRLDPGTWRKEWDDYIEPFRWFAGLFG